MSSVAGGVAVGVSAATSVLSETGHLTYPIPKVCRYRVGRGTEQHLAIVSSPLPVLALLSTSTPTSTVPLQLFHFDCSISIVPRQQHSSYILNSHHPRTPEEFYTIVIEQSTMPRSLDSQFPSSWTLLDPPFSSLCLIVGARLADRWLPCSSPRLLNNNHCTAQVLDPVDEHAGLAV